VRTIRLAVGLSLLVVVAAPSPAKADHEGSQHYSRRTASCISGDTSNLADPIGVVFAGTNSYAETHGFSHRAFDLIDQVATPAGQGWNSVTAGAQWVGSEGACSPTEYQAATSYQDRADGYSQEARYHVRLNQNHSKDSTGRFRAVGTPHYDVHINTQTCEDAVPPDVGSTTDPDSGFDLARGHLKNDWASAYGASKVGDVQNWANTRQIHQCNGWDSGSSGRVYFLLTN
jgi:hypothetical protein